MNQSKKLIDGALLTAIFVILMLVAIFVPGALLILIFILPVPFIIYAYKYDWKPSLVMLGSTILLALLYVSIISLPLTILAGLGGIMIGTAAHRNLSAYETLGRGTLGFIAGLLFIYIFTQVFLEIDLANEIDTIMNESLEMSRETLESFGFQEMTDEELAPLKEQLTGIKDLIPVGIAIMAMILALISQWFSYKLLNRLEKTKFQFPSFRSLQLPVSIV